jgi:lipopolysaccharide/colanic/teichoic acid biosynthesis glycosyltransferase
MELMTGLYERLTGRLLVEHAGRDLDLIVPVPDSTLKHFFRAGKRIVDLIAGVCGLLVLALLAPFIALANAIWSPGPLFYRQLRVGKGGKPFYIYKLRSMIPAAEENCGAVWSSENDHRITPVGKLLRKSRLDEFPQFLNVLKGDMSLVGPRPERPEFIAELVKEVPFYQARHAVKPGVTGWAQVRYRYGCSLQDSLVKLEYDLYYIRHQGLYLELSILVKTLAVMLGLKGR